MRKNYQNQNQRPAQPQYSGEWAFLNSPTEPPKKPSFFAENKKLVIITAVSMVLLLGVTILAVVSAPDDSTQQTLSTGPITDVPLTIYDGQQFAMSYAASMTVQVDEATEDPKGWFLNYADNLESPSYDISVEINNEVPFYIDGADAIADLFSGSGEPQLYPAVLAGVETEKTVIPITNSNGQDSLAVYSTAKLNDQYISVYGYYPVGNIDIADSFDSMIASITLNQ